MHDSPSPSGAVVESGPAATDRNYWIFVLLLCSGMAAWFFYDGAVGYLNKNRAEARRQLAQIGLNPVPALPARPTDDDFRALLRDLIRAGGGNPPGGTDQARLLRMLHETPRVMTPDEIEKHEAFRTPIHTRREPGDDVKYYASDYGMAIIHVRNGAIDWQKSAWTSFGKTPEEIRAQFYWALIPVAFGGYALYRMIGAATLRVVVDDRGLTYAGRLIPWEAMTSLRDYNRKGWVDLYHTAFGPEKRLRLDNQRIRLFDEVVDAIAQKTGFENPVKAYAEAQARAAEAESTT